MPPRHAYRSLSNMLIKLRAGVAGAMRFGVSRAFAIALAHTASLAIAGPLLADSLSWSNAGGGNAHVAGNWSPVQAPAAGDDLFFSLAGNYSVTYTSSMPSVHSALYLSGASVTAVCSSPHDCSNLGVYAGATLTLSSGTLGALSSLVVGSSAGTPGTLNLQGGSTLIGPTVAVAGGLDVGATTGIGELNITGGADLLMDGNFASIIDIGNDSGSTGTVTVSGTGFPTFNRSSLIAQPVNDIGIGQMGGTGTLEILGGGLVTCDDLSAGGIGGSVAEIVVSGGVPPTYLIRSTLDVADDMLIGYGVGTGTLEIGGKGLVIVGDRVVIGASAGGSGTLTMQPGSTLICTELAVDSTGSLYHFGGEIIIETVDGAIDTPAAGILLSGADAASPPTLTLRDGASIETDGDVVLGASLATHGELNIVGDGTELVLWDNTPLNIGDGAGGTGVVNVEDDGLIHGITVDAATVLVGRYGDGTLNINTGGQVIANNLRIATQAGSTGVVNLEGAGTWIHTYNNLHVGGSNSGPGGTGTLNVVDTTTDVDNNMVVWQDGTINVDNSSIDVDGTLDLRGTLTLDAVGSNINVDGGITILSNGTLAGEGLVQGDITNAGSINPAGPTGWGLDFTGLVSGAGVDFSGGLAQFHGGANGGFTGAGSVLCRIHGDSIITATGPLSLGNNAYLDGFDFDGTLLVGSQTVTLLDNNAARASITEIQGGTIVAPTGLWLRWQIDPAPQADLLRGFGIIQGELSCSNGIVAPGLPAPGDRTGVINVIGDFLIGSYYDESEIRIEGDGPAPAQRDGIVATGNVTLAGTLTVNWLNGYVPPNGSSAAIISGASVTGTFDTLNLPAHTQVIYGPTTVTLRRVTCPADVAPSGALDNRVDVLDLLSVINAWGSCAVPCPPRCGTDIMPTATGDCSVDVLDLLAVINAWGPCP